MKGKGTPPALSPMFLGDDAPKTAPTSIVAEKDGALPFSLIFTEGYEDVEHDGNDIDVTTTACSHPSPALVHFKQVFSS